MLVKVLDPLIAKFFNHGTRDPTGSSCDPLSTERISSGLDTVLKFSSRCENIVIRSLIRFPGWKRSLGRRL